MIDPLTINNVIYRESLILMISETKVDDSFPDSQFFLDGFETRFRLNRNRNGGGIMLYIRNYISAKVVSTDDRPIESFHVELNFRKKKLLLICSYNPKHNSIELHLHTVFPRVKIHCHLNTTIFRKYRDFHNETFLDSLRHVLNVQRQFLNEKELDVFSIIFTETFDKHAPKKAIYTI